MTYEPTEIPGVWIVTPRRFGDNRGYFMETYVQSSFAANTGIDPVFVQDNESVSSRGVLRGLHMQRGAHAQAKLVRVTEGEVVDVVVDLRRGSATYGRHLQVLLSDENHRQLFVPRGFAHGFVVISERAKFQYKVDNFYCPESEVCLRYDDSRLAISWPDPGVPYQLSAKDLKGISLDDFEKLL